jgi:hypothetical protein
VRPVISRVHHDRIVSNAQFVEPGQHGADVFIVRYHRIVVVALPALAFAFFRAMGPEMHTGGVVPHEKRLSFPVLLVDKLQGPLSHLFVDLKGANARIDVVRSLRGGPCVVS